MMRHQQDINRFKEGLIGEAVLDLFFYVSWEEKRDFLVGQAHHKGKVIELSVCWNFVTWMEIRLGDGESARPLP